MIRKMSNGERLLLSLFLLGLLGIGLVVFFQRQIEAEEYARKRLVAETLLRGLRLQELVEQYRTKQGTAPSFDEFQDMVKFLFQKPAEYLSGSQPGSQLVRQLNGSGGWVYEEASGRVSINTIKPISVGVGCVINPREIVFHPKPKLRWVGRNCDSQDIYPPNELIELASSEMRSALQEYLKSKGHEP